MQDKLDFVGGKRRHTIGWKRRMDLGGSGKGGEYDQHILYEILKELIKLKIEKKNLEKRKYLLLHIYIPVKEGEKENQ